MTLKSKAVESEIYASLGLDGKQKSVSETPRVVSIISALLQRTINNNEKLLTGSNKKNAVTIFHGSKAPNINIQQYLERIFKYSSCSPSCLVAAYIYLERFIQRTGAYLTSLNVHRLLITSSMVAAKVLDDDCYNNAYYARVGGVSTAEMNRLEMKFLFGVDFRLHVTAEDFLKYSLQLQKEGLDS
ncbi:cyclin-P3-1 [Corylus avellana]|uniref:cyclin-P3-1 n=1 Tax=Corylus avellana TaxID=13451 RepID=UPI001E23182E|nr:cyclin-P3-1 [Corylus avellana]